MEHFSEVEARIVEGDTQGEPRKHLTNKYKTCIRMHGVPGMSRYNRTQLGLLIGKVYGEI